MDSRARLMVANCEAASASDEHTRNVVRRAFAKATLHDVDVIFWSEIGDIDLEGRTPVGWDSMQFGRSGKDDPEAGCGLSWRLPAIAHEKKRILGTKATREGSWVTGKGIRERSIVQAKITVSDIGWEEWFNALHAPPSRAARARMAYMLKALREPGFAAGDTNFIQRVLARLKPVRRRTIRSVGVLAIFVPRKFWVSKPTKLNIGSDHMAFFVTVEKLNLRKIRLSK